MSGTIGIPYDPSVKTAHEAYSFACLGCGHGWEQSYEIAHHTDEAGHTSVTYYVGRQPVPSPLTRPRCMNCGGHLVRIMRSGRVSRVGRERPVGDAMLSQAAAAASWADPFNVLGGVAWDIGWERERGKKAAEDETERPGERRHRRNWIAVLLAVFRRDRERERDRSV
jgi:hypothetical protein